MKFKKTVLFLLIFVIINILNSVIVYADEVGCCANPGAGLRSCYDQRLVYRDAECCPTQSENPTYYESEENPFGPKSYDDCVTNYFYSGTACSSVDSCITGCCCEPTKAATKTRVECKGTGVTFHEGESDCSNVCTLPNCSDGKDNDGNGCADFPDDTGCTAADDEVESGGVCGVPKAGCDSISYTPELTNLEITPGQGERKGEREFSISWKDECADNINYYEIFRCKGNACNDFTLAGSSLVDSFTDDSGGLLFWEIYNYRIKAHYSIQAVTPSVEGTGSLGDLECWHKKDYAKFCIHPVYYHQYEDYLIANFGFTETSFDEQLTQEFSSRFNAPYYCNDLNKLIISGNKCSDDKICVIEGSTPNCIEKPDCYDKSGTNIFGLYFTQEQCENDKYCFYDRSFSIADNCFGCNPAMSCYDYKSKETCFGRDNCKIGNCKWEYLSEEFGIGVCVNTKQDNCKWCDKAGTEGMGSSRVTSKVFEVCTKQKAQKLSVANHTCYFKDGTAKSCKDVVCTDYGNEECSSSRITLSSSNEITNPSNDACGFKVCQLFGDNCKKNADGDNKADCESKDCEKDYFKPDTTITPIIDRGVYRSLIIQIFDKTTSVSEVTLRTSSDYRTYLCADCSGGHRFDISTNSYKLIISDLNVFDSDTGKKLLTLNEGINTIRYYSEDPSKNVGFVKELKNIETHGNVSGPIVYKVNVTGATKVKDTYYTSNLKPTIIVEFYEEASITQASLVNNDNKVRIKPSYSEEEIKKFIFEFSSTVGKGDYTFELNAKNKNNIFMDKTYLMNLVIDDSPPILTIEPEKGALIKEKNVPIKLTFDKEVNLDSVLINDEDFTSEFSSEDNKVFTTTLNLEDGNKIIKINAKDYAGNGISDLSDFVVNAHSLVISIKEPSYGVAPIYTFDVVVETDNNANCKYSFNDNLEYDFMDPFEVSGGIGHKISSFNKIPDGSTEEYIFYVKCDDGVYGLSTAVFKLRVDTTPPVIETAYAFPNPVIERPPETILNIKTDELTICKYSETQTGYTSMGDKFPGFEGDFRTVHKQNLSVPDIGSFTYYVGCENLAGLSSEIKPIKFSIDLTLPLVITDHTPRYSNSTMISLAIETNKKAQCKYSKEEDVEILGNIFGPVGYKHVKVLTLNGGIHKYYVKCKDRYLGEWSSVKEIEFMIDTSEPIMDYVNDSTALDNPEISWMADRLRVKWLARDNDTGIHHYLYTLEEFGTLKTIINWTISNIGGEWLWVTGNGGLNLSNGVKYYFRAKAKNLVGLVSNVMESNGVTVDINAKPTNCSNNVKDPSESDVDCGGDCEPCENDKKCSANIDCKSGYCEDGICKGSSCNDGVKQTANGETDVDCGGSVCLGCSDGKRCNQNSDCKSDYCSFGSCKADTCYDGELSGSESDVDCGGACPTKCSEGKHCDVDEDCLSGASCIDAVCRICPADDLNCDGIPDDTENDRDGDGMDDTWELEHGFEPNDPTDALLDSDGDGLTNLEEFRYKTDPNRADTDGDGYNDKEEIDKETDPLDPNSKPKSKIWMILFMLLAGVLVGGVGFVVYHRVALKREIQIKPGKPMPGFVHRPITPARRGLTPEQIRRIRMGEMQKKREEEMKKKRGKIFDTFGEEKKKSLGKEPKKGKREEVKEKAKPKKVEKKKEGEQDAFAKLSKLASEKQKKGKQRVRGKAKKEDAFKKLEKIAKGKKRK